MTREEFMDIVYGELHSDGDNNRANRIIDAGDLYADEVKPHWIPVTERLPTMGKSVLICDAYSDICLGHRTQCGYYYPDFCDDKIKDVRAWCNLPEPYKGVTE